MHHLNLKPEAIFLSSFNISSLFTNIPLKQTIQICADTLYNSKFVPLIISEALFTEMLTAAAFLVEFSFNKTLHKQSGGVAMGSPLGPALANMFIGYEEEELF